MQLITPSASAPPGTPICDRCGGFERRYLARNRRRMGSIFYWACCCDDDGVDPGDPWPGPGEDCVVGSKVNVLLSGGAICTNCRVSGGFTQKGISYTPGSIMGVRYGRTCGGGEGGPGCMYLSAAGQDSASGEAIVNRYSQPDCVNLDVVITITPGNVFCCVSAAGKITYLTVGADPATVFEFGPDAASPYTFGQAIPNQRACTTSSTVDVEGGTAAVQYVAAP